MSLQSQWTPIWGAQPGRFQPYPRDDWAARAQASWNSAADAGLSPGQKK